MSKVLVIYNKENIDLFSTVAKVKNIADKYTYTILDENANDLKKESLNADYLIVMYDTEREFNNRDLEQVWRYFRDEIRWKRKEGGEIVVLYNSSLDSSRLPFGIRQCKNLSFDNLSQLPAILKSLEKTAVPKTTTTEHDYLKTSTVHLKTETSGLKSDALWGNKSKGEDFSIITKESKEEHEAHSVDKKMTASKNASLQNEQERNKLNDTKALDDYGHDYLKTSTVHLKTETSGLKSDSIWGNKNKGEDFNINASESKDDHNKNCIDNKISIGQKNSYGGISQSLDTKADKDYSAKCNTDIDPSNVEKMFEGIDTVATDNEEFFYYYDKDAGIYKKQYYEVVKEEKTYNYVGNKKVSSSQNQANSDASNQNNNSKYNSNYNNQNNNSTDNYNTNNYNNNQNNNYSNPFSNRANDQDSFNRDFGSYNKKPETKKSAGGLAVFIFIIIFLSVFIPIIVNLINM